MQARAGGAVGANINGRDVAERCCPLRTCGHKYCAPGQWTTPVGTDSAICLVTVSPTSTRIYTLSWTFSCVGCKFTDHLRCVYFVGAIVSVIDRLRLCTHNESASTSLFSARQAFLATEAQSDVMAEVCVALWRNWLRRLTRASTESRFILCFSFHLQGSAARSVPATKVCIWTIRS